ncbi:hypothetical protein Hdeb2414_s0007g00244901 [Helianthus debilis subsp. tardiflorus]
MFFRLIQPILYLSHKPYISLSLSLSRFICADNTPHPHNSSPLVYTYKHPQANFISENSLEHHHLHLNKNPIIINALKILSHGFHLDTLTPRRNSNRKFITFIRIPLSKRNYTPSSSLITHTLVEIQNSPELGKTTGETRGGSSTCSVYDFLLHLLLVLTPVDI